MAIRIATKSDRNRNRLIIRCLAVRQSLTHDWRWRIWGEEVRSVFRFSLSESQHVVKIYGHSTGFIIDRLAFFRIEDDAFAQQPPKEILDLLTQAAGAD